VRIKVTPDLERARSMLKLIEQRENFTSRIDKTEFPTIVVEGYYEIIKELVSVYLLVNGAKMVGENAHKDLIDELFRIKKINESEKVFLQDLRVKRNQSSYEGKQIEVVYLINNEKRILEIIKNLKSEVIRVLR